MNRPWFWVPATLCALSATLTAFAAAHGYPSWGGFLLSATGFAVAAWSRRAS